MRLGAKIPTTGGADIGAMAARIENAGFDSVWFADHIVMTEHRDSRYPFTNDGEPTWDPHAPWLEAVACMAVAAASTTRVEIGTAVLVAPIRDPILLGKQLATLDVISGGRVTLGIGGGWYREEFDALGVDFASRGAAMDEWIEVVRAVWTDGSARAGDHFRIVDGTIFSPRPAHPIELLVGGTSGRALRRAGTLGDGWVAVQRPDQLDAAALAPQIETLRAAAAGLRRRAPRVVLRVSGSAGHAMTVAHHLDELRAVGVDDVVVDLAWDGDHDPEDAFAVLSAAVTS